VNEFLRIYINDNKSIGGVIDFVDAPLLHLYIFFKAIMWNIILSKEEEYTKNVSALNLASE